MTMFDPIGICDTCGRPAFSLTEINNPCNDIAAGLLFANKVIALTHLRGTGRAWIQTLPFNELARRIVQTAPQEKRPS